MSRKWEDVPVRFTLETPAEKCRTALMLLGGIQDLHGHEVPLYDAATKRIWEAIQQLERAK